MATTNAPDRPLILLSNDDGFDAAGLLALRAALLRFANVVVCAPLTNQSASSHSLTLNSVLRLRRIEDDIFAVDGTPADCVYIALHAEQRILPRPPDMVVSGMNHGPNLGIDVVYSGTVAAAREAAQRGIPALAVSASSKAALPAAAALGAEIAKALLAQIQVFPATVPTASPTLPTRGQDAPLYGLNIPAGDQWRVHATRLGERRYRNDVIFRRDPRQREYMWIGGSDVEHDQHEDTDTAAWDRGHASLTPLALDMFEPAGTPLANAVVAALALTSPPAS